MFSANLYFYGQKSEIIVLLVKKKALFATDSATYGKIAKKRCKV
jgi:hypothetical protein